MELGNLQKDDREGRGECYSEQAVKGREGNDNYARRWWEKLDI